MPEKKKTGLRWENIPDAVKLIGMCVGLLTGTFGFIMSSINRYNTVTNVVSDYPKLKNEVDSLKTEIRAINQQIKIK